jgi:hypothetical protein
LGYIEGTGQAFGGHESAAVMAFGAVERFIGGTQQFGGRASVVWINGNPA